MVLLISLEIGLVNFFCVAEIPLLIIIIGDFVVHQIDRAVLNLIRQTRIIDRINTQCDAHCFLKHRPNCAVL